MMSSIPVTIVRSTSNTQLDSESVKWKKDLMAAFRGLVTRQYDTSVDVAILEMELEDHLDENVQFRDPWQAGGGKAFYILGQKGFHKMLWFHFDTKQITVDVDEKNMTARVLVDGIMHLEALKPILIFPLRTILVYTLRLERPASKEHPIGWKIVDHEEMWSLADIIENIPGVGWCYGWFRYFFSRGFLAASWLSTAGLQYLKTRQ